jgi:predicted phosphodiesterase
MIEEKNLIYSLYAEEEDGRKLYSYREIAEIVNGKFRTLYWDYERVRDTIRKHRRNEIKKQIDEMELPEAGHSVKCGKKKILVLFDLHFPYTREDIFDIIKKNLNGLDAIVFGGDTLNNDSLSSFPNADPPNFDKELIDFYWFIAKIRAMVSEEVMFYFIRGNHEARLYKYIANKASHDQLSSFVDPEVINMLVTGFSIFHDGYTDKFLPIPNIKYIPHWFMNINDEVVICHPLSFSRIQLKTVSEAIEHFIEVGEKFSAIAVGHMHVNGYMEKKGKHGYNIGCLCKPQKYADSGKLLYKPQNYGYMVIILDKNGKFEPNTSQLVVLPEIYPFTRVETEYKVNI